VKTGSSHPSDYKNTGYDKGHLTQCDDLRWSKQSKSESFLMSSTSPQTYSFNAGIWKRLEGLMKKYTITFGTIYIAAGSIFEKGLSIIGRNKVSDPKYFYKVVLVYREHSNGAKGFILLYKQSKNDLLSFAVSVDSVEKRTGIIFFALLPVSIKINWKQHFKRIYGEFSIR
jgi:endonuclease G